MKKRKSRIVPLLLSVFSLKKILSTTTGKIWNFFIYYIRVSSKFNKAKARTITENSGKVSHDLDCPKGKTVINKKIQNQTGRFFYFLNNQARNKCLCVQERKICALKRIKDLPKMIYINSLAVVFDTMVQIWLKKRNKFIKLIKNLQKTFPLNFRQKIIKHVSNLNKGQV